MGGQFISGKDHIILPNKRSDIGGRGIGSMKEAVGLIKEISHEEILIQSMDEDYFNENNEKNY